MFWRVLQGSLRHRRARLAVATLAVLLGAAMVSALANLSFDVGGQTSRELRAYGANLLLLPRGAALGLGSVGDELGIPERDLAALDGLPGVVGFVPYLHLVAETAGQPIVVAGLDFERLRAGRPPWRVEGRWPAGPDEALLGVDLARALGLEPGDRLAVGLRQARHELAVAGLVETGAAEDGQVLVSLPTAQAIGGRPSQVGLVEVSALTSDRPLPQIAAEIEARLPGLQARTLRQLAQAEDAVLARVRLLMALVAAAVVAVAALALASTMVTAVLERRAEIGLMKALGASERRVAAFFLAEGVSVGLLGGLAGYAAGLALAALIGRQVFQADLRPSALGLPATLGVAIGVALLASLWPMRRAMAIDPAITLRGE